VNGHSESSRFCNDIRLQQIQKVIRLDVYQFDRHSGHDLKVDRQDHIARRSVAVIQHHCRTAEQTAWRCRTAPRYYGILEAPHHSFSTDGVLDPDLGDVYTFFTQASGARDRFHENDFSTLVPYNTPRIMRRRFHRERPRDHLGLTVLQVGDRLREAKIRQIDTVRPGCDGQAYGKDAAFVAFRIHAAHISGVEPNIDFVLGLLTTRYTVRIDRDHGNKLDLETSLVDKGNLIMGDIRDEAVLCVHQVSKCQNNTEFVWTWVLVRHSRHKTRTTSECIRVLVKGTCPSNERARRTSKRKSGRKASYCQRS